MISKAKNGEVLNFKLRGDAKLRRFTGYDFDMEQGFIYIEMEKENGGIDYYFIPREALDYIVAYPDRNKKTAGDFEE